MQKTIQGKSSNGKIISLYIFCDDQVSLELNAWIKIINTIDIGSKLSYEGELTDDITYRCKAKDISEKQQCVTLVSGKSEFIVNNKFRTITPKKPAEKKPERKKLWDSTIA